MRGWETCKEEDHPVTMMHTLFCFQGKCQVGTTNSWNVCTARDHSITMLDTVAFYTETVSNEVGGKESDLSLRWTPSAFRRLLL